MARVAARFWGCRRPTGPVLAGAIPSLPPPLRIHRLCSVSAPHVSVRVQDAVQRIQHQARSGQASASDFEHGLRLVAAALAKPHEHPMADSEREALVACVERWVRSDFTYNTKSQPSTWHFNLALSIFMKVPHPSRSLHLWPRIMSLVGVDPDENTYLMLLNYARRRNNKEHFNMVRRNVLLALNRGLKLSSSKFFQLELQLDYMDQFKGPAFVEAVYQRALAHDLCDTNLFEAILLAHRTTGSAQHACEWFERMMRQGVAPVRKTVHALMAACSNAGDVARLRWAAQWFEHAKLGYVGSTYFWMISGYCKDLRVDEALALWRRCRAEGKHGSVRSAVAHCFMDAYARRGEWSNVQLWWQKLQEWEVVQLQEPALKNGEVASVIPTSAYTCVLRACWELGDVDSGVSAWNALLTSRMRLADSATLSGGKALAPLLFHNNCCIATGRLFQREQRNRDLLDWYHRALRWSLGHGTNSHTKRTHQNNWITPLSVPGGLIHPTAILDLQAADRGRCEVRRSLAKALCSGAVLEMYKEAYYMLMSQPLYVGQVMVKKQRARSRRFHASGRAPLFLQAVEASKRRQYHVVAALYKAHLRTFNLKDMSDDVLAALLRGLQRSGEIDLAHELASRTRHIVCKRKVMDCVPSVTIPLLELYYSTQRPQEAQAVMHELKQCVRQRMLPHPVFHVHFKWASSDWASLLRHWDGMVVGEGLQPDVVSYMWMVAGCYLSHQSEATRKRWVKALLLSGRRFTDHPSVPRGGTELLCWWLSREGLPSTYVSHEWVELWSLMTHLGYQPNSVDIARLVGAAAAVGDAHSAMYVWLEAVCGGMGPDVTPQVHNRVLHLQLKAIHRSEDTEPAYIVWTWMRDNGIALAGPAKTWLLQQAKTSQSPPCSKMWYHMAAYLAQSARTVDGVDPPDLPETTQRVIEQRLAEPQCWRRLLRFPLDLRTWDEMLTAANS